ncbi:hypothetical protein [Flavivirga eckloniae]|uniref:Type II secretion system protein n=1 Tax=Flavivirga eckloniae TaxID=1803846 RepID=A0A2K9PRM9_9FLAO|nr:hypothetical protein [Flavivirga eckloniae]AUP79699.1 hypothetical protein C1H87_13670 [Flavivirga eckloniae]
MVVLKKIKASTLMETLVATVLIVIVFMISSMILNNIFSNSIKSNTREIDAYLNELEYLYKNEKLKLPYYDDLGDWKISIITLNTSSSYKSVEFEALHIITNKTKTKVIRED